MLEFVRGSLHAFFCMMGFLVWIGIFVILLGVLPGWISVPLLFCTVIVIILWVVTGTGSSSCN